MIDIEIDKTKLGLNLSKTTMWQKMRKLCDLDKGLNLFGISRHIVAKDRLAKKLNKYSEYNEIFSTLDNILLCEELYCHRCGEKLKLDVLTGVYHECLCAKCSSLLHNENLLNKLRNRNKSEIMSKSDKVVRGLML